MHRCNISATGPHVTPFLCTSSRAESIGRVQSLLLFCAAQLNAQNQEWKPGSRRKETVLCEGHPVSSEMATSAATQHFNSACAAAECAEPGMGGAAEAAATLNMHFRSQPFTFACVPRAAKCAEPGVGGAAGGGRHAGRAGRLCRLLRRGGGPHLPSLLPAPRCAQTDLFLSRLSGLSAKATQARCCLPLTF